MTSRASLRNDSQTITVHVPWTLRKRGGRKLVVAPEEADWAPRRVRVDNALVKAVARAFRWRQFLESGRFGSIGEVAAHENINASYVGRVLRLSLLAPSIVEMILDGRQPPMLQLRDLLNPIQSDWRGQLSTLRIEQQLD